MISWSMKIIKKQNTNKNIVIATGSEVVSLLGLEIDEKNILLDGCFVLTKYQKN